MIVICTKCQAKFRVADEKIPPRGAKVRCSKCQTVFLVHPDLGTMPLGGTAQRPERPPASAAPATTPVPATWTNVVAPPPVQASPPPAPAVFDDDPFAAAAASAPHAESAQPPERAFPLPDDPFAAMAGPAAPPQEPRATLPVTDLSDLLASPPARPPLPSVPPPLPASHAPLAFDEGLFAAASAPEAVAGLDLTEAPLRSALAALPPDAFEESAEGGLALEDRLTPPPARVRSLGFGAGELAEPSFDGAMPAFDGAAASIDPFKAGAQPARFDPGSFDLSGEVAQGGELPLGGDRAASPAAAPAPAALPAAAPQARDARTAPDERIRGRRTSRVRSAAVSVVSLAVIVFVAVGFLVAWRADGPLEVGAFHPAAVIATLRRDGPTAAPFAARDVRSGVYERSRGAPLLFVRGNVVSRAPAAVRRVTVAVEIVRAGKVLARGEAVAGAVPTAEELHAASDAAALAAVARHAAARAPRDVKPGDAVPFLVAIGDAPADLDGASLRMTVAAARSASP
jgi:predicted Zn finger-like uncharacterized protein